ncbi:flagellar basal body P-ring formation chaperone FlgA [Stakelama tenebrarum]|uniref:Flagella basal body P-ring formation protein FlgA n=1 Tax=Stakelama tenebrarum TaxID=2711215 RepID=A0A6G6Y4E3_9SPHN|nr:flagellar basal body P-ring formation chaperone FlgA [Sphingosinithalassobacter tenebrarum]QIG79677.1 flagellar basal body P-ring formation protein FlgA [Sphingosinithalassobacter tenebrarum]
MRALLALGAALVAIVLPLEAAAQDVEVAVLVRDVPRGELVSASDFAVDTGTQVQARSALSPGEAAGMEARRNLREGSIVRRTDIQEPRLVRRGEPVTIRLVNGSLVIATSGRALGDAADGELVRVVTNTTSHTLDAVVDGPGSVRIALP